MSPVSFSKSSLPDSQILNWMSAMGPGPAVSCSEKTWVWMVSSMSSVETPAAVSPGTGLG